MHRLKGSHGRANTRSTGVVSRKIESGRSGRRQQTKLTNDSDSFRIADHRESDQASQYKGVYRDRSGKLRASRLRTRNFRSARNHFSMCVIAWFQQLESPRPPVRLFKIRMIATIVFQFRVVAGTPYSLSIWPR